MSEARANDISLIDETEEYEISDSSIMNFENSEDENYRLKYYLKYYLKY